MGSLVALTLAWGAGVHFGVNGDGMMGGVAEVPLGVGMLVTAVARSYARWQRAGSERTGVRRMAGMPLPPEGQSRQ